MESTRDTRNRIRAARRAASQEERAIWSHRICACVAALGSFQAANTVAGFLAFDGEADPAELMVQAIDQGKQVYVPTIIDKGEPLMFVPWSENCELEENRYGIFEPVVPQSEWIEAGQLDFVITPLVAFDESCNRIGVGGGFYDRSFSFLNDSKNNSEESNVQLVGFAFELQKVKSIKTNDWDIPLSAVATEVCLRQRVPE